MKIIRYLYQNQTQYGILADDVVQVLAGPPYEGLKKTEQHIPVAAVKLLAPCEPTKIIALGLNYRDHAEEMRMALPQEPLIFMKPSTSVIGPGGGHRLSAASRIGWIMKLNWRWSLAAGPARISEAEAGNYILGYTCCNDVTARDLQKKDGQFTRSKSFDTFAPLGPWIETALADPGNITVEAYVNGQRRQHSHTEQSHFRCGHPGKFYLTYYDPVAGRRHLHRHSIRRWSAAARRYRRDTPGRYRLLAQSGG